MADKRLEAEGSVQSEVWVGGTTDLERLVAAVRDLAKYASDQQLARFDEKSADRQRAYEESYSFQSPEKIATGWTQKEADNRSRVADAATLNMEVKQRRWSLKHSGDPAEVIPDIDADDVTSVSISFGQEYVPGVQRYALTVLLNEGGAGAAFRGPESNFVDLAGTRLSAEFKRDRPWYWWFRAPWSVWVIVAPATVGSYSLSSWMLMQSVPAVLVLLAVLPLTLVVLPLVVWSLRRLARPFELTSGSQGSRSARSFRLIGASALWVLGTVVVPVVLAAVAGR